MTKPRIQFLGEGPTDVGCVPRKAIGPVHEDAVAGVLPALTRSLLERHWRRQVEFESFPRRLPRVSRGGFEAKVHRALKEAHAREYSAVAVVLDRDGSPGHQRLDALRRGRDLARAAGVPLPCACGIAVEAIEAWLLQPVAVAEALDLAAPPEQPKAPESLGGKRGADDHPKTVFNAWCRTPGAKSFKTATEAMAAVAAKIDTAELERTCKQGFGAFADHVRAEIAPVFGGCEQPA